VDASCVVEGTLRQMSRVVGRIAGCACVAALVSAGCIRRKHDKPGAGSGSQAGAVTPGAGATASVPADERRNVVTGPPAAPASATAPATSATPAAPIDPMTPTALLPMEDMTGLPAVADCLRTLRSTGKVVRTIQRSCGPITVRDSFAVDGILILEAGVVLRFEHQTGFTVGADRVARLFVRGTASDPVILTSTDDHSPGAWTGVELGDRARGSQITGLVIENAGANGAALSVFAVDVTLTGSTIRNAKGAGLDVLGSGAFAAMSGNMFEHAGDVAIKVDARSASTLGTNFFEPGEFVEIRGGSILEDTRWQNPGAPYVVTAGIGIAGRQRPATLEIAAGTEVRMRSEIRVGGGYHPGTLVVSGTPDLPVVFSADNHQPTGWRNISIERNGEARITNATIANGGGNSLGALTLDGGTLTVTGTRFEGNQRALVARERGTLQRFDHNRIAACPEPALTLDADQVGGLGPDNVFDNEAQIQITGGTVKRSATWAPQGVPYQVDSRISVENNATLTVLPGVEMVFDHGAGLNIGFRSDGSLKALGTADRPITLRPAHQGLPWFGVSLSLRTVSAELAHVVFNDNANEAAITIADGVPVTLTDVRCVHCAHDLYRAGCRATVTASGVVSDGEPTHFKPFCPH